jgi:hypothetical protein
MIDIGLQHTRNTVLAEAHLLVYGRRMKKSQRKGQVLSLRDDTRYGPLGAGIDSALIPCRAGNPG